MKKSVMIIIAILLLIIVIVAAVFFNLNKEKKSITASDFYNIMKDKGYIVSNANEQFSEYNYIKQVYLAADKDYKYQIEFYEISDNTNAVNFYENNKLIFESSKGDSSSYTDVSFKNYSKYTLSTDGKYKVLSRVNNTVIYLDVKNEYKNDVNKIIKELGY